MPQTNSKYDTGRSSRSRRGEPNLVLLPVLSLSLTHAPRLAYQMHSRASSLVVANKRAVLCAEPNVISHVMLAKRRRRCCLRSIRRMVNQLLPALLLYRSLLQLQRKTNMLYVQIVQVVVAVHHQISLKLFLLHSTGVVPHLLHLPQKPVLYIGLFLHASSITTIAPNYAGQ